MHHRELYENNCQKYTYFLILQEISKRCLINISKRAASSTLLREFLKSFLDSAQILDIQSN